MSKPKIVLSVVLLITLVAPLAIRWAKRHTESRNCASGICSICLGARSWADDHAGLLPMDFVCMSNEINTTKILVCAADHERRPAPSWASFTPDNCGYELLSPGLPATNSNTEVLRCKAHGDVGHADDTEFDGMRRRGKYY